MLFLKFVRGVVSFRLTEDLGAMSDSDIIIRMLYFCEVPKLPSQIMTHCELDYAKFRKFSGHCMKRDLLRAVASEQGLFALQITERGREVLETADAITTELGIGEDEPLK